MAVTDDERRRVAAALRDYASFDCEDEGEEECLVDCADWGERVLNLLGCGDTEGECYAALADLIEPSCDRDTPQKVAEEMFGRMRHSTKEEADAYDAMLKSKSVEIHPVDRDALLGMEDEIFESATGLALISELEEDAELKDLQTTMAKVLFGYARRIREACGEVDG